MQIILDNLKAMNINYEEKDLLLNIEEETYKKFD